MTKLPSLILILTGYVTVTLEADGERNEIHSQIITYLDRTEHSYCPGCSSIKAEIDDIELAELRVEFIKQQILKKLKLKEVPRVSPPVNKLPIPILTRNMYRAAARKSLHDQDFQEDDDFFGKTNQVILFPEGKFQGPKAQGSVITLKKRKIKRCGRIDAKHFAKTDNEIVE